MLTGMRLFLLVLLHQSVIAAMTCYDISSPREPHILKPVDCWHKSLLRRKMKGFGPDLSSGAPEKYSGALLFDTWPSPVNQILNMAALPPPDGNATMAFNMQIDCTVVSFQTCARVGETMTQAARYLSQVRSRSSQPF